MFSTVQSMKKLIYIILVFSCCVFYAQEFIVLDSLTKESLPFSNIIIDNKGFYTNENGRFSIKENSKAIEISHLGYKNFSSDIRKIKDTIFLIPKPIIIKEVIISSDNNEKIQKIGYLKKTKYSIGLLSSKEENIIVIVPTNSAIIDNYIEKVEFPLNKFKLYNKKDKLYKNVPAVIRINIYTVENNLPKERIFSSKPIKFIMSEKEVISVDISEEMIKLPKNGLSFGIEMIGRVNNNGEFIEENAHTRPIFTDQLSKDYKAVTYRTSLKEKEEYYPVNDINPYLMRDIKKYKPQNYNLAIGLVIKKAIEN